MNATETQPSEATAEALFARRAVRVMEAVDLHHTHLVNFVRHLTRQEQDAEDICQELWRYVVVHFKFEQITSISLLKRKARQLFIDHYRAAKRRKEVLTGDTLDTEWSVPRENHYSGAGEAVLKEKFWSEFPGIDLSPEQKEVLWLHARYGWTYAEIEARFGIASSTVGDWVALGRERLSAYLDLEN